MTNPGTVGVRGVRISAAAALYLGVGAVLIAIYPLLGDTAQNVVYLAIGLTAIAMTLRAIPKRGGLHGAWFWFGVGLMLDLAGDAVDAGYELFANRAAPLPSAADIFYIAGYPALAFGAYRLLNKLGAKITRSTVLDSVIILIAVATVQWLFVIDDTTKRAQGAGTKLIAVAYPAMDVLLLVVAAELVFHPIGKSIGHKLLIASIAMLVVGDEISYVVANQSTASTGGVADLFWLASYVIWGAASIEPPPEAPFVDRRRVPRLTGARLTLLGGGVLSVPVALVVEQATGRSAHAYVAAGGAGAISLLVLIRLRDVVRAIEAQNVRMRELDQLKDDFVASVSHELRTPLTSISGYLDLLEEDAHTFNEEHQSFLRIVNTNTGRLLRLVNDLLIVAGLQARRLDIEIAPVDVTALLEHSVQVVAPSARAKGLELTADVEPALVVPGDAHRLAQLVDNLLANAIKFTDTGTIKLRGFRNGADVVVVVEDSGIGIPEADQPRVFDRFFRSADAVAQAVQGTGLGIYIARQIADAHGAAISVASRPGEETTFSVLLPGAETSVSGV